MPGNQEQSNQNNHVENNNAYLYNPNRPNQENDTSSLGQINQNATTSDTNQNQNVDKHADTKKVVDTAAKAAANYFAPGVGGTAYEAAKQVPGAGKVIDKATDNIAKKVDKVPGMKKLTKGLNDSGATDAVNKGMDMMGGNPSASAGGANFGKASGASIPQRSNAQATPATSMRKNTNFQNQLQSANTENIEGSPSNDATSPESSNNQSANNSSLNPLKNFENQNQGNTNKSNQQNSSVGGELMDQAFKMLWNKYKIPIILAGGGIALFLIFFLVLFGGGASENDLAGYYDQCNFNETNVTVTNCYTTSTTQQTLSSFTIDDLVISAAYAYTKDGTYSEEAIKAMMITLKTNILSYGNYNSSDKNVSVQICDIYSEYVEPADDENKLSIFEGAEDQDTLTNLYNEIANYLYLSSSYQTTISNLSNQNILEFNKSTLDRFESLAQSGSSYQDILEEVYDIYGDDTENTDDTNDTEEGNTPETQVRDTLFLGDSRVTGMVNAGILNTSNTIYSNGYGFDWLEGAGPFDSSITNSTNGGIAGINNLMQDNTTYNIVIMFGINDLDTSAEEYYRLYYELATTDWRRHHIYVIALGPVEDVTDFTNYDNSDVDAFNNTMDDLINGANLSNLTFVDLYYSIQEYDEYGINYGAADYQIIYDNIMDSLEEEVVLNPDYEIYNLNTYCTFYTLTENDAYWWPVGSAEPSNGNIYGGTPISVTITSYFGPRYVQGSYDPGHGAIDIGVARGTPIIATKSGTVILTQTGCTEGNTSCGQTYGNFVKLDHGDGVESLYAHLTSLAVSDGDTVSQGQVIGYSGNTGNSTGPHLHFEIRINGTRVDPLEYVDPENPRPVQYSSYNFGDVESGTAEENKAAICNMLLDNGFSNNAVAGMLINIASEGAFITNNMEDCYQDGMTCDLNSDGVCDYGWCVDPVPGGFGASDSAYTAGVDSGAYTRSQFVNDWVGYGLVGWTAPERKAGLYDYAKSQNKSIASVSVQVGYLLEELQQSAYAVTYKYITGTGYSVYDVAYNFCTNFERPYNMISNCSNRASSRQAEYSAYVNNGCSY